tara:strand:- start:303 stop:737 length:435 start_codon:yes stop_codon:yes gene_type:complete
MEVYTDGSCLGNPGFGGWAAKCDEFEIVGSAEKTTNNIMELTAVLRALEACLAERVYDVCIITDSFYCKNGISSWIHGWKRNGWKTSAGTPVKNKELWVAIDALVPKFKNVEWRWVKAHNGHPQNEAVDKMARDEATRLKNSCA